MSAILNIVRIEYQCGRLAESTLQLDDGAEGVAKHHNTSFSIKSYKVYVPRFWHSVNATKVGVLCLDLKILSQGQFFQPLGGDCHLILQEMSSVGLGEISQTRSWTFAPPTELPQNKESKSSFVFFLPLWLSCC